MTIVVDTRIRCDHPDCVAVIAAGVADTHLRKQALRQARLAGWWHDHTGDYCPQHQPPNHHGGTGR